MAEASLSTDRRTALAALALLPLTINLPSTGAFHTALANYRSAKAAVLTVRGTITGDDWVNDLVSRLDASISDLMLAPSPSGDALALKLEIAAAEYDGEILPEHLRALIADARRFGGLA
jgi:hypothetical protein